MNDTHADTDTDAEDTHTRPRARESEVTLTEGKPDQTSQPSPAQPTTSWRRGRTGWLVVVEGVAHHNTHSRRQKERGEILCLLWG